MRRRELLIGVAVTLPLALSGCALADRTVDLVSDLSMDALRFLEGEEKTSTASTPETKPGEPKPPATGQSLTLALPSAKVETKEGHSVVWNLGNYMAAELPRRPQQGAATAARRKSIDTEPERVLETAAGPLSSVSESIDNPVLAARQAEPAMNAAPGGSGAWNRDRWKAWSDELPAPLASGAARSDLTLSFVPGQGSLSERDKVQLSMLVWPLLDDEATTVLVHAYLPRERSQGEAAPIAPLRRGTNVRAYLAHLGLPRDRVAFRLLTDPDPGQHAERVEVVVTRPGGGPNDNLARNRMGAPGQFQESDMARAEGLAAFHKKLRSFADELSAGASAPAKEPENPKPPENPNTKEPEPKARLKDSPDVKQEKAEAKPTSPGKLSVQLASLPDPAQAKEEWARLKAAFPELLRAMSPVLQQVELEGRGHFHRVRTGNFADREAATELCRQLLKRGQDCLVVLNRQSAGSQIASAEPASD